MTSQPDMPPAFRTTLARLELLSHGHTQSFNSSGGGKTERDHVLAHGKGIELHPHDQYRRDWHRAKDGAGRARVERDATDCLAAWTKRAAPQHVMTPAEILEDLKEEALKRAGWTPKEVVSSMRSQVTPGQVMAWREEDGKDISTGFEPRGEEPPIAQAHRLHKLGLGVRQIALYQKVDASTVSRRLRKAA